MLASGPTTPTRAVRKRSHWRRVSSDEAEARNRSLWSARIKARSRSSYSANSQPWTGTGVRRGRRPILGRADHEVGENRPEAEVEIVPSEPSRSTHPWHDTIPQRYRRTHEHRSYTAWKSELQRCNHSMYYYPDSHLFEHNPSLHYRKSTKHQLFHSCLYGRRSR